MVPQEEQESTREFLQVGYGPEVINLYPFVNELSKLRKVLFITTSNRSPFVAKQGEKAKSTQLAEHLAGIITRKGAEVEVIDASALNIHNCLGCVSELHGNMCGSKPSSVKDKEKNPTGNLRCWASHDFEDDELWKIVNPLYESDAVVFFSSQRWGTANAIYQKLIERLDWIENMHYSMGEPSTVEGKKAGFVLLGQNWRVQESVNMQREVLEYYGFDTPPELFMGWQFTRDVQDESEESYKEAPYTFEQSWSLQLYIPDIKHGEESPQEPKSFKVKGFGDFLSQLGI
jgi:multimeric flavodoxin WrbA